MVYWRTNQEPDIARYYLYRGETPEFAVTPATLSPKRYEVLSRALGYRRLAWRSYYYQLHYIDRQTLSILSPRLRKQLHISESDYANIVTAFLVPYTLMYLLRGRFMDAVGVRLGLTLSLAWSSLATTLTGFARGAFSLGLYRFLLGICEPCVYPAGVKVCGEWFPSRLRATATGIFSSGSALGAILAPPVIAWLTIRFGWQYAFLIPGVLGLLWLPVWW